MNTLKQSDKAGSTYWDQCWQNTNIPTTFDHTNQSLDNYPNLQFHQLFSTLIQKNKQLKILEIGCANSIWPIYFHQYHNAEVFGLDYSEIGCEKSRKLFKHFNVPGTVYQEDLFNPPEELKNTFDMVFSFGVVEHFENTAECLKACSAYLKPSGKLVTVIPNIPSIIGFLQKMVDRDIYDIHVPLTKKKFAKAHHDAELNLQSCEHFMSIHLGIVVSKKFRKMLSVPTKLLWIAERYGIRLPRNRLTSPYIVAIANKECSS
ncbi:MAG: class I SAM-dependent methyltransferase [Pseudomonadota bacterium]